ncbi:hypothetical protein NDA11_001067 [Ustilago hordei]|uniref:Mid2 domain-containing protein n=1 Tax=Ustilago hordei TaxID=120017 RepID=I2FXQ3_USTHO|nr:uncharacterized protein UHO2_00153 [Ustilago hordei]KAJ1044393.1 hypothetical protein NDA10_007233 [Ustilago hordei]KAJ1570559.1 hypothetical protein NDA11_001067 [Ustilago hordei]KAJ1587578.1 hypothetical protein NDA15_006780 [Ustilago hordei]KAJ1590269.1 hypothetical protein NDA12_005721 [Ustilago hordei]UTT96892.1 hypothetical protein NDA17_004818 [Ustilago hordei]
MQIKSNHAYLTLLLSILPLLLVHGANVTLPSLTSCEPAEILISATGNYTIQGRDIATHKLVFHEHIDQGVDHVTWNPVDLPPNSIALISILDQTSPSTTSLTSSQAAILPNALGNTSCLARDKGRRKTTGAQKTMVATIIGIVLGAFFLLVLLLVIGMMYRRKKEKEVKEQDDCVDHSCAGEQVIAGGSYMQRLVPGLSLQDAKPLPRDRSTEREQLDWASTRRANRHCKENTGGGAGGAGGAGGGFELPNYNPTPATRGNADSAREAKTKDPFASQPNSPYNPTQQQQQQHNKHKATEQDNRQSTF